MIITISTSRVLKIRQFFSRWENVFTLLLLTAISIYYFWYYLQNGLGLSYNDARSHLDIGRRVVEGLKPGMAQLGSVWLPLNHMLMIPLIWNDWMWHSGFAGAVWNMLSFIGTGLIISQYLKKLNIDWIGRLVGVAVFAANVNVLYLQSTAMTEPLLLFTMTMSCYYLLTWHQNEGILGLIKAALWVMLATLVRYDGWFLLGVAGLLVLRHSWVTGTDLDSWKVRFSRMEGITVLFSTLAVMGVVGWFVWNLLIFRDPLYFMLGEFSAHAQQLVMEAAGALPTKHDLLLSLKVYFYSFFYSSYTYPAILAIIAYIYMWRDKTINLESRFASLALWAPLAFNILALYFGFSVIYVQGISGDTWFNIRYGVMLAPTLAIMIGYLVGRAKAFRPLLIGSLLFVLFFAFANHDAVSIDDARVGSSQKNVSEVSGYLNEHAKDTPGFILISAASHDAIIFSSGLPMKKFIHEGTGKYWESATTTPDRWARWIVMRTYDDADLTWKAVSRVPGFANYNLVTTYPFASIYELKPEFMNHLQIDAVIKDNK
ncbi:hypothetical protein KBD75_00920 [Candidatus Woesebacteria bacterium]|nr:hypothetical protein [Candidatus Woesebacteria bacterium]